MCHDGPNFLTGDILCSKTGRRMSSDIAGLRRKYIRFTGFWSSQNVAWGTWEKRAVRERTPLSLCRESSWLLGSWDKWVTTDRYLSRSPVIMERPHSEHTEHSVETPKNCPGLEVRTTPCSKCPNTKCETEIEPL